MLIDNYKISYSPKNIGNESNILNELYYEELKAIPDIEPGRIVIHTVYVYDLGNTVEIKVFFINSANRNVNFKDSSLVVVSEDGKVIAKSTINLADVGEIPPMNIRPYSLVFNKSDVISLDKLNDKCKVAFDIDQSTTKLSQKLPLKHIDENISLYEQRIIENYINELPPVINDTFQLQVYKTNIDSENKLYSILIATNGVSKNVEVNQFKLIYRELSGLLFAGKVISNLPTISAKSVSVFKIELEKEEIVRYPTDIQNISVEIVG